jgi:phosphoenolpyruvate phosphomutase / 2-hydroxyethylphosphonate cytidylyltransferase
MANSQNRLPKLRRLLKEHSFLRILEAHSGLAGIIVERSKARRGHRVVQFDGIWFSSFTSATIKGLPDNEQFDVEARVRSLSELCAVTTKPIIYDADNGGEPEDLCKLVHVLERLGVSALIVHDRAGRVCNSLSDVAAVQQQENVEAFCAKLRRALDARVSKDFMVIARVESLIRGAGVADAVRRGCAYAEAGCDGIMMHSRSAHADEVLECCRRFFRRCPAVPLVIVPSTYPGVSEDELSEAGVRIVIYANQLLRSAYPAMASTANCILETGRALEAERRCLPIPETLRLLEHDPLPCEEAVKRESAGR